MLATCTSRSSSRASERQRLQPKRWNRPSCPALASRSICGFAVGLAAATVQTGLLHPEQRIRTCPVSEENYKTEGSALDVQPLQGLRIRPSSFQARRVAWIALKINHVVA